MEDYSNKETWKKIKNCPNYEVSNTGMIKSLGNDKDRKEKILKQFMNKKDDGYCVVKLCDCGKIRMTTVHRLVAEAFIPNPDNLPEINHKDECKTNNYVHVNPDGSVNIELSNLEWCDHKYNCNYGHRNRKISNSHNKPVIMFTLDGKIAAVFPSCMKAAEVLGVCQSNISACATGKTRKAYGYRWVLVDDYLKQVS